MQPIKMLANNIKNVYNISLIKKERIRKQYDENSLIFLKHTNICIFKNLEVFPSFGGITHMNLIYFY